MIISEEIYKILLIVFEYFSLFAGAVYLISLAIKFKKNDSIKISYNSIHLIFIISMLFGALLATFLQYETWASNDFTRSLTLLPTLRDVPLPGLLFMFKPIFYLNHGYFYHYSIIHFWMAAIWNIIASSLLYFGLCFLQRKKDYLIRKEEAHFIFAASLIIGWPNLLFFLALMFLIFTIHSIINLIRGSSRTVIFPSAVLTFLVIFVGHNVLNITLPYLNQLSFIIK